MTIAAGAKLLWSERSGRERLLLAIAAVLLGGTLLWYGIAAPLRDGRDEAAAHLAQAAETQSVIDAAAALEQPAASAEQILASLAPEGLRLDRHDIGDAGEITVRATAPDPASLFGWIRVLQEEFGVAVANLTVSRNNDGAFAVEAILSGAGT
jgi:type II secretory pathway component PulM